MQTVHVKFLTEADRNRGFYELIHRTRVNSLPGKIYQIPREALDTLDQLHIGYRRATDDEVKEAHGQVRDSSASIL
jgi:hypothetical protein